MTVASASFTHVYIARPLDIILHEMTKALVFDFSDVRDGTAERIEKSVIAEVSATQESFTKLLQTFAVALKCGFATCPGSRVALKSPVLQYA